MARTDLTVIDMATSANTLDGVVMTGVAGTADGKMFVVTGQEVVLITKTTSTGNVTFLAPGTAGRDPITDRAVEIGTGALPTVISGFNPKNFAQSTGKCHVDFQDSEETEFTMQVFKIPNAR